jgi:hypothetical protein
MLDIEFSFYLDHQEDLVGKYNNKFLVIVGQEVKASFKTQEQAYKFAIGEFGEGKFLLQLCTPGKDEYTQTFQPRVIFG